MTANCLQLLLQFEMGNSFERHPQVIVGSEVVSGWYSSVSNEMAFVGRQPGGSCYEFSLCFDRIVRDI